jgi:hypothetical protein
LEPASNPRHATAEWIIAGSAASLASAAVLSICGFIENGRPAGPNNGPSQWIWGRRAAYRRKFSIRHTVAGYLIHHASSLFWSAIHVRLHAHRQPETPLQRDLLEGAATAGLACFVDYQLTPRRFQPGFEAQLSKRSLFLVYAAFGLGLSLTRRAMRVRGRQGDSGGSG